LSISTIHSGLALLAGVDLVVGAASVSVTDRSGAVAGGGITS